jgi:UDP-N-acetylenolpyruvoylglucosamine reductase
VRKTVLDRFGISLDPEPVFWGFGPSVGGLPLVD